MEIQSFIKPLVFIVAGWFIVNVSLAFVAIVFPNINGKITLLKSEFNDDYIVLEDDIVITEISDNENILPYEYESGTGDVQAAKEIVLEHDGEISDRVRFFDKDPGKMYMYLKEILS